MASDLEIVIGAKDQASAILEKVASSSASMVKSVSGAATKAQSSGTKISNAMTAVKTAMGPLLAVFAAYKAATAGFSFASDSIEAFNVQAEAVRGLGKSLELAGDVNSAAIPAAIKSHQAFASALQISANVGDEVTLGLMRQASMLGVSSDQLQDVTKAAIGLSEATGTGLEESLKKVNETINGNTMAMADSLPGLRNMATDEKRLAEVMRVATNGLLQKQDAVNTLPGVMQRAANSYGDLQESIGQLLAPIKMLIGQGFAVFSETLTGMLAPAVEYVAKAMQNIGPIMEMVGDIATSIGNVVGVAFNAIVAVASSLKDTIVSAFGLSSDSIGSFSDFIQSAAEYVIGAITIAEVIFANFGTVVGIVMDQAKLYAIAFAEDVKHLFTSVIPQYLTWFGDNWRNVMTDIGSAAITIFSNWTEKVRGVLTVAFTAGLRVGQWFAENFTSLMTDMGNAVATIVSNYAQKWIATFNAFKDFIASGFAGGISKLTGDLQNALSGNLLEGFEAQTKSLPDALQGVGAEMDQVLRGGLLDGFKATTAELPTILGRSITDAEQELQASIAGAAEKLGEEFATKFNDRTKDLGKDIEGQLKTDIEIDLKKKNAETAKSESVLQAVSSRLLQRGKNEDVSKTIAENTKQSAATLKAIAKNTEAKKLEPIKPQALEIVVVS